MAKKPKTIQQVRNELTILLEKYPLKKGKQDFSKQIFTAFEKQDYLSIIKRLDYFKKAHCNEPNCQEFFGRSTQISKELKRFIS